MFHLIVFLGKFLYDGLVKSQFWDDTVKSSSCKARKSVTKQVPAVTKVPILVTEIFYKRQKPCESCLVEETFKVEETQQILERTIDKSIQIHKEFSSNIWDVEAEKRALRDLFRSLTRLTA